MANDSAAAASELKSFLIMLAGAAGMTALAFLAGRLLNTPLAPMLKGTPASIAIGVAATAPLAALLFIFMRSKNAAIVNFRNDQLDFLSQIGFRLTPLRIAAISLGAGVSEELLFRGVAQSWTQNHYGVVAGLILPSIIFGLLHARNAMYAVIAGSVGLYLGVLFLITGDLVAPIVTHALYDYIALEFTRRALAERRLVE
jgi:hypothetical protein